MSILSRLRRRPPSGAAPPPPPPRSSPLSELAGALLAQLTLAQAQADNASYELGDLYRQHPVLARFPVPSLSLESAEMDLRVALVAPDPEARAAAGETAALADVAERAVPPVPAAVHVLFDPSHLASVPPEHVTTVRMTVRCSPKRLVEVDGHPLLLP